jgi:hypothetical protein
MYPGATSTVHAGADIHSLPQLIDLARIRPDQDVTQGEAHRVRSGRLDARLRDPGIDVAFAEARDAFVSLIATIKLSWAEEVSALL